MSTDNNGKKITAYITKWWQARGIITAEGELKNENYFSVREAGVYLYLDPRDYALTLDEARAQVEAKRMVRVNALRKQLAKVEKLKTSTMEAKPA